MSGLTDAISQAEQNIIGNTKGQLNQANANAKGAVADAINNVRNAATGAVSNVVSGGLKAVSSAATDALTGNFSGALSDLGAGLSATGSSFLGGLAGLAGSVSSGSILPLDSPGNPLTGALGRPDPMLSFTWYAQMPVLTPSSISTGLTSAGSVLGGTGSVLGGLASAMGGALFTSVASTSLPWSYVETANLPFRTIQTKSIFREGHDNHYPDKYSVDNLRLGIYSDSSNIAFQYIQAWNNLIIAPFSPNTAATAGGYWGRPVDYKKTIYIYLMDVTKNVVAIVQYVGCFPINVDAYSLISNGSERIVNEINFSVDDVFINLISVPSVAGLIGKAEQGLLGGAVNLASSIVTGGLSQVANAGLTAIKSAASSFF